MGKQCFYLLGDTHYKRRKGGRESSFNFLLFKLSDDGFLLEKSLIILSNILFLEFFLFKLFSSSESSSVDLMVIIDLLRVFIFL